MKKLLKKLLPPKMLGAYHYSLAMLGAFFYGFPSRKLMVIAVTGTKGKSSTVEIIHSILTAAGLTVAAASTIRFTIGEISEPNLFKMTMPGRFFLQQFLRKAVNRGATHAVIEMTSEGAKQFRHKGIELDALVFTNLAPEHLESHGSIEAYAAAKLSLAKHLEESPKRPRFLVANGDDKWGKEFLKTKVEHSVPFSLSLAEPYSVDDKSIRFVWKQGDLFTVPLPGLFNLKNVLAALTLGEAIGLELSVMHKALEHMHPIAGRAERVVKGQQFTVMVDYAHTPDSLRALFETFKQKRIIAVMGSTGGGRDKWKRQEMGRIAEEYCDTVFLTNEDPYDEDPQAIIDDISRGFAKKRPHVILDRRGAIREAFREAKEGDVVLITGKGTDPYIMGPRESKQEWSDKKVAEEELKKLGYN
ncbi:MAG: UDP-N-acetylmuramoyl-L-alanyl-D-glutamate--2,6-diaminopimelate ligase [Patescibacteria group bacterium]